MFDALKFFRDYNIEHTTEGERARHGWVQIHCPFCGGGGRGYDLGYNLKRGYFNCWICQGHSVINVVRRLLSCGVDAALDIARRYKGRMPIEHLRTTASQQKQKIEFPTGCAEMQLRHYEYLEKRKFDPELLEKTYDLRGTGKHGDYRNRIIAPIYLEGRLVSYQGRDITGRHSLSYKACPMTDEIVHHKHTVYGIDQASGLSCVVVEGIVDAWRLGPGAIATFGTGYKQQQALMIAKRFLRTFILFDAETIAQRVAKELAYELAYRGCETHIVELDSGDPGEMDQSDANALMREIKLKGWNY